MNIGMVSAWNEDCGPSVHAELIGREWIKMGHQLKVFSFLRTDFHGTSIVGEDEEYVSRCFTTSKAERPFLSPQPLLETEFEIFVVQDLGMLPQTELARIFLLIKKKGKIVNIIHHNILPLEPSFYQFDWDAIVCFDDRYHHFLRRVFPEEKLHLISFPFYPLRSGDKLKAREELNLSKDKYIVLLFGQRGVKGCCELFPSLEKINSRFPLLFLVVSKRGLDEVKNYRGGLEILIREEAPDIERVYTYLHASDLLLYHRSPPEGAVVSSTACQCLGSGSPILALRSSYFYKMDNVVFTYTNLDEFEYNLIDILERGEKYYTWQKNLQGFLEANSANNIANQYIQLFYSLLEKERPMGFELIKGCLRN